LLWEDCSFSSCSAEEEGVAEEVTVTTAVMGTMMIRKRLKKITSEVHAVVAAEGFFPLWRRRGVYGLVTYSDKQEVIK